MRDSSSVSVKPQLLTPFKLLSLPNHAAPHNHSLAYLDATAPVD